MEFLISLLVYGYLVWLVYQGGKRYGSRKGFAAGRFGSRPRKR